MYVVKKYMETICNITNVLNELRCQKIIDYLKNGVLDKLTLLKLVKESTLGYEKLLNADIDSAFLQEIEAADHFNNNEDFIISIFNPEIDQKVDEVIINFYNFHKMTLQIGMLFIKIRSGLFFTQNIKSLPLPVVNNVFSISTPIKKDLAISSRLISQTAVV